MAPEELQEYIRSDGCLRQHSCVGVPLSLGLPLHHSLKLQSSTQAQTLNIMVCNIIQTYWIDRATSAIENITVQTYLLSQHNIHPAAAS